MHIPLSKAAEKLEREQITVRLPKEIMDKLRQQAADMGISINDVVIIYLRKGFQLE